MVSPVGCEVNTVVDDIKATADLKVIANLSNNSLQQKHNLVNYQRLIYSEKTSQDGIKV